MTDQKSVPQHLAGQAQLPIYNLISTQCTLLNPFSCLRFFYFRNCNYSFFYLVNNNLSCTITQQLVCCIFITILWCRNSASLPFCSTYTIKHRIQWWTQNCSNCDLPNWLFYNQSQLKCSIGRQQNNMKQVVIRLTWAQTVQSMYVHSMC